MAAPPADPSWPLRGDPPPLLRNFGFILYAQLMRPASLLILLLFLLLTGCSFPRNGGGGMAEVRAPKPENREGVAALHLRLACQVDRTDALREALQAKGALTGRIIPASDLATRAQREFYGGLHGDSARTLDRLEAELLALGPLLPPGVPLPLECPPA
ncbi:hypothetical protein E2C06_34515 [Dankookia rubra]|uniref:Uncharacterized protein n=1 Tax=Dankookia rubra TaxID=1442381 RepID=A0A4R5Q6A3_9PROT|nr:hypothetical protein [Dankookia rubra]TDH58073.1 hypothetical protein E2C06_34515 [Dankookia rubra]